MTSNDLIMIVYPEVLESNMMPPGKTKIYVQIFQGTVLAKTCYKSYNIYARNQICVYQKCARCN